MLAIVVGGYCYKTSQALCPPGTKVIAPIAGLIGAFVFIGLIGVIYLAIRGRTGG